MKIVHNLTWRDKHGVIHVAYWGDSPTTNYGWHLRCNRQLITYTQAEASLLFEAPTCVWCAVMR